MLLFNFCSEIKIYCSGTKRNAKRSINDLNIKALPVELPDTISTSCTCMIASSPQVKLYYKINFGGAKQLYMQINELFGKKYHIS